MNRETAMLIVPRGTPVQFVDEVSGAYTEGMFIGPETCRDYIVLPAESAQKTPRVGEPLFARYRIQDHMIEFRSAILEVIDYPMTMWRIQAPTTIDYFTLRAHHRIPCALPASVEIDQQGFFVPGIIRNISKSGARCLFRGVSGGPQLVQANDPVTLRCTFPGLFGKQVANGRIATVLQRDDELSVGIQFTDTQDWVPSYH